MRIRPPHLRHFISSAVDTARQACSISLRARSLAGVALAPGRHGEAEALLVWSAIDQRQPQVFLTLVSATGKKLRQKMLTRSPGEVSDIAAVNVGDGWLVAWVDERSKDPEVYVTRVNRQLVRAGPEHRLTRSPGAVKSTWVILPRMASSPPEAEIRPAVSTAKGKPNVLISAISIADQNGGERAHDITIGIWLIIIIHVLDRRIHKPDNALVVI